jgi:hypothetical protein
MTTDTTSGLAPVCTIVMELAGADVCAMMAARSAAFTGAVSDAAPVIVSVSVTAILFSVTFGGFVKFAVREATIVFVIAVTVAAVNDPFGTLTAYVALTCETKGGGPGGGGGLGSGGLGGGDGLGGGGLGGTGGLGLGDGGGLGAGGGLGGGGA